MPPQYGNVTRATQRTMSQPPSHSFSSRADQPPLSSASASASMRGETRVVVGELLEVREGDLPGDDRVRVGDVGRRVVGRRAPARRPCPSGTARRQRVLLPQSIPISSPTRRASSLLKLGLLAMQVRSLDGLPWRSGPLNSRFAVKPSRDHSHVPRVAVRSSARGCRTLNPPSFTTAVQEVVLFLTDDEETALPDRYFYDMTTTAQPCLVPTSGGRDQEFRGDVVVRDLDS